MPAHLVDSMMAARRGASHLVVFPVWEAFMAEEAFTVAAVSMVVVDTGNRNV